MVAVVVGIIAGPLVTNGFNPYSWDHHDEITKQLTRCIIAIQVQTTSKKNYYNYFSLIFFFAPLLLKL